MVAAEVAPFARVGGLSDVVGALAKEVSKLGHEVVVCLPKYRAVDEQTFGIVPVRDVGTLSLSMGDSTDEAELFECHLPGAESVRVIFVGSDEFFDRDGIYTDPDTGHGYPDEVVRYSVFSRAVLETVKALDLKPDVIHLNDHHTSMVAVYKTMLYGEGDDVLARAGVVFSIHNLGYQGVFSKELLPRLGLSEDLSSPGSPFEFHGDVNSLKLGIHFSNMVNTVSETYAEEISSGPEFGLGLEGVLGERRKAGTLVGILNGVDYSVWDPSADALIPQRYSADKIKGKRKCKAALLKRGHLVKDISMPLIGMISRLADQKGFDLVRDVAPGIIELGANLVVLGTGQREYHEFLEKLATHYPRRVSANLRFDNELAHWIEAGSDMFLMPSRYEPCGLNQMYSLRYGTVPMVRATGGLADTVEDYDVERDTGTGFTFSEYDSQEMLATIERAVSLFQDTPAWDRLVHRGMEQDFGWGVSAMRYVHLHEEAVRLQRQAQGSGVR